MRKRMFSSCLLMAILQVITWYSAATSKPYASSSTSDNQLHQYTPEVASHFRQELRRRSKDGVVYGSEGVRGELSRLGSRPPSCKHRCEGCVPCDAIQIPESEEDKGHVHVQYANYEPEGWKCKCGLSTFNP